MKIEKAGKQVKSAGLGGAVISLMAQDQGYSDLSI